MIQLQRSSTYYGPNPYATDPVIVAGLDLSPEVVRNAGFLAEKMSGIFASRWLNAPGRDGESPDLFIAKYLSAWSLFALNKVAGYLLAAGAKQTGNGVHIWLGFHDPDLSFDCLSLGARFFTDIGNGKVTRRQISEAMNGIWKRCAKSHPDFQAIVLIEAARKRRIPYRSFSPHVRRWQFGWGRNSLVYFESGSEEDSSLGVTLSKYKTISKDFFANLGAPVARHFVVDTADQLDQAALQVGWPCVIKPVSMAQARGVTVNIRDIDELRAAFARARKLTREPILVESHVEGDVYRLLVIRGKFCTASRREPATVVGDGISTVLELAEQFNRQRAERAILRGRLGPVPIDGDLDLAISKQGYDRDSVPAAGKKIRLREVPLQGTGASNTDVSHLVHPDVKFMAESLARTLGIQIAGLDYISSDISRPFTETGVFLEINGTPSLLGHLEDGKDVRGVGNAILGPHPGRIPVFMVLAERNELDEYSGNRLDHTGLGWFCGKTVGLSGTILKADGPDLPGAADMLLKNKCVEAVLMTCTAGELAEHGLPFDEIDHGFINADALDPTWMEVIRKHCRNLDPLPSPAQFSVIMKKNLDPKD